MTIWTILYTLLIGPLELLFDIVYALAYQIIENPGLSIIVLSIVMNFLVLPLYHRADIMQEEERQQSLTLQPGIAHIKKTFSGDERFMMLQTYFRQNNYKPYYALKGSLSLLLEIPFFIAAYNYLSNLQMIQDVAMGPIVDLGQPDRLIQLGSITINLLPILMTLVNMASATIYMKGLPLKNKVQMFGIAGVFLVLLYNSPSGLVFYWTLNNFFSLAKNIFYKLKNPRKVLYGLSSICGIAVLVYFISYPPAGMRRKTIVALSVVLFELPVLLSVYRSRHPLRLIVGEKTSKKVFFICSVFLTVLTGVLIPSAIINASPDEFVTLMAFKSPLLYVFNSLLLATGTFLIWFTVFYQISDAEGKSRFSLVAAMATFTGVIDYMFFGKDYGIISSLLQYEEKITINRSQYAINFTVIILLVAVLWIIWKKKPSLLQTMCLAGCIAVIGMSVANVLSIAKQISALENRLAAEKKDAATLPLDKSGRNVIVIMMDRAVGGFIPYLIEEKPELVAQYDGFTYYPNTISYGAATNVGSPPIYGGYEYVPEEINRRNDTLLREKQNEALKVMPVNFLENGFEVTVCDPPYANYEWIPDLSIYNDYPTIRAYRTINSFPESQKASIVSNDHIRNRDLFCYSLFRISPLLFHESLYNKGLYNEADAIGGYSRVTAQITIGTSRAYGTNATFYGSYSVLQRLTSITQIQDTGKDTFLMLSNDMTHEVMMLQEPEYVPQNTVDNTEYDREHKIRTAADGSELQLTEDAQLIHYQCNMAAMIQLGNWFDYLKAQGVYDNTRIIIVSDHGRHLNLFNLQKPDPQTGEYRDFRDFVCFTALLLVKDFNSNGFTVDNSFMTNADTPLLAFSGLIENPVNPKTGSPIIDTSKYSGRQHILYTTWRTEESENDGTAFITDVNKGAHWITFRNFNAWDISNWSVDDD